MTIGERIHMKRIRQGMTQAELGNVLEVSKSAIGSWETDRARPDLGKVPELCRILHMTLNEFYGMTEAKDGLTKSERKHLTEYRALSTRDKRTVDGLIGTLLTLASEEVADGTSVLKVDDIYRRYMNELYVSAGLGEDLLSDSRGSYMYIHLPQLVGRKTDELIRVNGDSMEPTYHNGDVLMVHHQEELNPGEIGVFIVGGAGYVREYQPDGLHSHNQKYKVIRLSGENDVRCIGKVIGKVEDDQLATDEEVASMEERKGGGRPTVR